MIRRVIIRRFKRFKDETFDFPGHIVLAGPNNCGKTTVLQAIAAWSLALTRWKQLNDLKKHSGAYARAPIARQAFSAVPLRSFDLLWNERSYGGLVEVEVQHQKGSTIAMEFQADSTEQIHVRPRRDAEAAVLRDEEPRTVFVPPMTGLSTEEPVYQRPKLDHLLGQGKPGEIIRNLLVEAYGREEAWRRLSESMRRLFGYEVLPPDDTGAHILCEYRVPPLEMSYDIASAGSGFQQVLMLLAFLHTRPGSVLLLDEPDAHLHLILQDAIYGELRSVAARQGSQLVIATHSEVIINSVEPAELCMLLDKPRILESVEERARLADSLRVLSNVDVLQALECPGVLYVEDYTDIAILREWARILDHPARETLSTKVFWRKTSWSPRPGAPGIRSRDHYEALKLVRNDLPGLELLDGDALPGIQPTPITGTGLQRLRWRRYEIESYLLHPEALARYVAHVVGAGAAQAHVADLRKHFEENHPPAFLRDPLTDLPFLVGTKARTDLIPPALSAAGLPAIPHTSFDAITALMKPEEIHPEVREKLDAIQRAFRL